MKRVVLDTNVMIAALFWKGKPRTIYELVRHGKIIMLMSADMEKEFIRVLGYKKFGLSPKEIIPLIREIRKHTEFVNTTSRISIIKEDPTDNVFLECGIDGKADYIISGDKHLLNLHSFKGIQILNAGEFLIKENFLEDENV